MYRFLPAAALFLALCGCTPIPDSYAPPIQRRPQGDTPGRALGPFISMADPRANNHIVQDISKTVEAEAWRWTGQNPELRFYLEDVKNLTLLVELAFAGETLKSTGPVSVQFQVNGKTLDTVRYNEAGGHTFTKPVPPSWLHANSINTVRLALDKVWVSPEDGNRLGVILTRAGFTD